MRIGYLTYGLDRAPTGIGRYAVQLLEALTALPDGPDLVLLTTEQADHHGLWGRFERYALPGCRLLPALMTAGNAAVSVAAARLGLDVIHDPNGVAPFLGPALGVRRVVTIHDAVPFRFPAQHNRLDNWRFRMMLPLAARCADAVITVSASARQDLAHFLRLHEHKIYLTGEAAGSEFAPASPEAVAAVLTRLGVQQPYLLYLGGLNGRKNVERLLAAFAEVRRAHPALTLVIVGKRQWRAEGIEVALAQYELEPYVRFTGYLPDADVPLLYSGATAFVFPSLYEGFGLPVLEAMACGAPVVTSNVSSLPEVAGDAALLVDPCDTAAIAAAIRRIIEEPGLAERLRTRGLARAAQFSWERTAEETLAVYHRLNEKQPSGTFRP
ncbi:glycosyltransferase family 4 protein [Candidatus Chloroploca asiatica]|uniref:Glycosyl transferase family 1 n=1 Tax=Candidatus Chloroploca asiatica TaxID=1506545 RepID=A0A2H3KM26_9CHLR|nr:glycosyltransferase family 1 protein [Candidatus Chloroploca asiatica]PDV99075.1 hypothetical protein A9Q02_13400 [Candidatus Chloroploca asiatica]